MAHHFAGAGCDDWPLKIWLSRSESKRENAHHPSRGVALPLGVAVGLQLARPLCLRNQHS